MMTESMIGIKNKAYSDEKALLMTRSRTTKSASVIGKFVCTGITTTRTHKRQQRSRPRIFCSVSDNTTRTLSWLWSLLFLTLLLVDNVQYHRHQRTATPPPRRMPSSASSSRLMCAVVEALTPISLISSTHTIKTYSGRSTSTSTRRNVGRRKINHLSFIIPTTTALSTTAAATAVTRTATNTKCSSQILPTSTSTIVPELEPLQPTTIVVRIPEPVWRAAASDYRERVHTLLQPGLVHRDHPLMKPIRSQQRRQQHQQQQQQQQQHANTSVTDNNSQQTTTTAGPSTNNDTGSNKKRNGNNNNNSNSTTIDATTITDTTDWMTILDCTHPVYNFLVEYYGLKGLKGPKRLARWSPPSLGLLINTILMSQNTTDSKKRYTFNDAGNDAALQQSRPSTTPGTTLTRTIESLEELYEASSSLSLLPTEKNDYNDNDDDGEQETTTRSTSSTMMSFLDTILKDDTNTDNNDDGRRSSNNDNNNCINNYNYYDSGIYLEGATPDDFGQILHLKGAEPWMVENQNNYQEPEILESLLSSERKGKDNNAIGGGVFYRPFRHYNPRIIDDGIDDDNYNVHPVDSESLTMNKEINKTNTTTTTTTTNNNNNNNNKNRATSLVWYKSILESTLSNDPILHCYGLHEWAMQYHPVGAKEPASSKYQSHLSLRIPREVISATVERKGVRCTHVDALRFFAPAAAPLNHHGASLDRTQQLQLENPGCVHANMDLLKIALKLIPYCDPMLFLEILEIALESRTLDVGASPYDCSQYNTTNFNYNTGRTTTATTTTTVINDSNLITKQIHSSSSSSSTTMIPIPIIPVETTEGRKLYKELQTKLMLKARPIRNKLLENYLVFLKLGFTSDQLIEADLYPSKERYATAEPGGLPWRQNLIPTKIQPNHESTSQFTQ